MTELKELVSEILPEVIAYLQAKESSKKEQKRLDNNMNTSIHCVKEESLNE